MLRLPPLEGQDVQRRVLGHARAEAAGEACRGVVAPRGAGEQLVASGESRLQPDQLRARVDHRPTHGRFTEQDLRRVENKACLAGQIRGQPEAWR